MSAETDLYAALAAAGPVTSIVGEAIYPDIVPEKVTLPAVTFERAETEYINTIHGAAAATLVAIDIWCMSSSRLSADTLADAVEAACSAARFYPTGRRSELDSETETWATVLTVEYWP